MKSLTFILFSFMVASMATAEVDGIWQESTSPDTFYSIQTHDGVIVVIELNADSGIWAALQGPFDGSEADIAVVIGPGQITSKISFASETEATITVFSCQADPGASCETQPGGSFTIQKVFK